MGFNPAISNEAIPPGSRHLVVGDSLVNDLNEIFIKRHTTVLSFGEASMAQVIKMMEFQGEDHLDTLVIMLGTNDVGAPTGLPFERTEGEIQAETRGAVHDTAEPGDGHDGGGF